MSLITHTVTSNTFCIICKGPAHESPAHAHALSDITDIGAALHTRSVILQEFRRTETAGGANLGAG